MGDERDPRTHAILAAAMAVHRELGCGFLEPVYQQSMGIELESRQIPFVRELELPIIYKGRRLSTAYRIDFLCHDDVVIEVKALPRLSNVEQAQLLNYLKAGCFATGLLINFGTTSLEWKRLAGRRKLESPHTGEDQPPHDL